MILISNDFWHKGKIYNFDPYNVLLAIATFPDSNFQTMDFQTIFNMGVNRHWFTDSMTVIMSIRYHDASRLNKIHLCNSWKLLQLNSMPFHTFPDHIGTVFTM